MPTRKPSAAPAPAPQPESSAKAPGRPPRGSRALTGAERQRAYEKRQRDAVMTAYGKPQGQPTNAILAALGRQLKQLDDSGKADQHKALRYMAERGMRELCQRYGLNPNRQADKSRKSS